MLSIRTITAAVIILLATQTAARADFASSVAKKLIIAASYGSGYGGYIGYDGSSVDALCRRHRENPDALIVIDQEGGAVTRYKDPASTPIAPRKLGSVTVPQYFEHSVSVAKHLKQDHCIDVNFGIVYEPIWGPAIVRSIPTTMDDVYKYGRAFADAMQEGGVIPGLKHFVSGRAKMTHF